METGILIIAYDNEVYYKYANNLAHSIKLNSDCKIQIVCDDKINNIINDDKNSPFDYVTNINEVYCSPAEMKMMMYDFSLFEKTLFIDADSLIFPNININWILKELEEDIFMCSNGGIYNIQENENLSLINAGGTIKKFIDHFDIKNERITKVHSFFMYFKKDIKTKEYFEKSKEVYRVLVKNAIALELEEWKNCVNDEIAYSISSSLMDFHPRVSHYNPLLVGVQGKGMFSDLLLLFSMKGKVGITMPEINVDSHSIQIYNLVCSVVGASRKVKAYSWENK